MANTIDDKINSYILANPQLRTLPEEKIISILVEKGVITKAEAQKVSAFARTEIVKSDKGITLERQIPEKTSAQPITAKTDFTEEQAQDFSIDMIAENALNAEDLLNNIHNGTITQGYDNLKNFFNTELSSNNVKDVINYEKSSTVYLQRAKSGTLTKKDYIKENKGRISDMLLERLEREDKESGIDFIDKNRGNIAREDYKQLLKKEIDRRINQIRNIEDLKKFQLEIIALTDEQETKMLQNIAVAAIKNEAERPKDMGPVINMELTPLEDTVPADELMDFETTYKYERDTDFSEKYMEELAQSKGEMNLATGAYNKTQILKNKVREMEENYSAATKVYMSPDGIATGGGEPSPETRAMEAAEFFTEYYKAAPQNALQDLSAIIKKQNLDIDVKLDDNGSMSLNFGELYKTDYEKNKALNTLLKVSVQEQEKRLNGLLGGKSYESYLEKYQTDYKNALGERNATAMAEAFKEDQLTIIDSVTGTTSLTGMGVMAVGGILTLTPAAPAGVVLMSAGGKIALGGMASRHILGFSDEFSKDEQSQERLNRMYKDLALDLGGLIIGGAAGRQGLKFASQIVRNGGNKALAIVVEKGTDFTLSAAGDLAMIGALHYDQGLEQTLKANGIGILVSTLTGIKASKELFKGDFPTDIPAAQMQAAPQPQSPVQNRRTASGAQEDTEQGIYRNEAGSDDDFDAGFEALRARMEAGRRAAESEDESRSVLQKPEEEPPADNFDAGFEALRARMEARRNGSEQADKNKSLAERLLEEEDDFLSGVEDRVAFVSGEEFTQKMRLIKNPALRDIAEKAYNEGDLNRQELAKLEELQFNLENINDAKINKYIKDELERAKELDDPYLTGEDRLEILSKLNRVADAYHTLRGDYTRYVTERPLTGDLKDPTPVEYLNFLRENDPETAQKFEEFIAGAQTGKQDTGATKAQQNLVQDFIQAQKTEALKELAGSAQKNDIADYMYKEMYIKNLDLPQAVKDKCTEISEKYNSKIFLSAKSEDAAAEIKLIEQEYKDWEDATGGNASYPRVLDMSTINKIYIDDNSAYGSRAGGETQQIGATIRLNGGTEASIHHVLRHEMMHLNDRMPLSQKARDEMNRLFAEIAPKKNVRLGSLQLNRLDYENCKYKEEFLKAGIHPAHISYAYNSRNEFLAVAAEGDMSKYSPKFKEVLKKLGMPEEIFKLPVRNPHIIQNSQIAGQVRADLPDKDFETVADYAKDEIEMREIFNALKERGTNPFETRLRTDDGEALYTRAPEDDELSPRANNDANLTSSLKGLSPDEFNTKLLDMDENTFKDELINFVVTLRRKGNETVTNEEIIEVRNSEEINEFYKLYSQVPEVFAILMKKDINGEYVYSNMEKADFMLCRFDDFENANPKELLEEVQLAEKFYNYFDAPEKYPAETLGLGERQNALLKKLESEITDPIDVYDMNRIIDTIVTLRKDRDFDYYEKLESSQIAQADILTTVKRLKTDEQRDMFDKILTQTKSWKSDYWKSDYITAVEMATTHNIPHLKEYISRILAQENPKLLESELTSLSNMRYSDAFKERSYLLKDERLNIENIKSLCYMEPNKYENNVINRKLLEDKTLTGDQIVRLANADDKHFDAYNKLKNTNLSKEEAIGVATYTYRIDEIIENNDYLLNMNLTKDDWDYVSQRVYTDDLLELKARTELQDPSLNLTIAERIDLAKDFSTQFGTEGQYTAMLERGLLQDKSLTCKQIKLLTRLPDTEYAIAKERDILHNVNENELNLWNLDRLISMDDETYNNYLDIQNNPTENMKKRGLTFDEKRILADCTKEELASIDEYLYFENRVVDQFNLNDCKELSRNIDIRKNVYPEESVTAAKSAIKQLADNKTLADQKQEPLSVIEIYQLMDGDGIDTEVLNLVTHEGRNSSGAVRLSAKNAKDLYEMTQHPYGSPQKYTPEESAEQRELLEKLIYIPERGSAQIEPENLSRIMAQLGSVENFEKHKDFIYNADRAAHNIPQWNGNEIFKHIMHMPDEWLPKAKKFMFIEERGTKQFNAYEVRHLAELEDEELLRSVEKYIKNPNFNVGHITKITEQNESVRAKLDEISGYNYQADVLIEAAKLDDECFNNFKTIAESAIIKNDETILECASLKGEKFKQLTELMQIEKAYNQTNYFKEIASLDSEQFAIAKQLLENGHHGGLALTVAKCKDKKILEKYDKAIEEAKKKRNQLKSGVADLTDHDIDNFFNKNMSSILMTIDMVGLPAFTHSYTSKLTGVESFVNAVSSLKQNLSAEDFADLEARINDKSLEPQEKIAKLRTLGVILNTYTNPQEFISLIKPNTPSKDEIQKAKAIWANPKAKFDDKLNEFCETFGLDKDNKKVVEFFNKRAQTNAKGYKILNGVKESELAKLLEIEVVRKRNEHEWNTAIDKKVYEEIGVTYTPELSRRLNLADNKYLSTFFHANRGFKENFGEMVDHIVENPDKSIREIFDELPQNIETQRQFEKYGIDYDKWVSANKDSYLVVEVEASAQKSRQAAIANLEADLNDPDFKAIPKEETDKIFNALEEIGVTTKTKKEPRYDEDGFIRGYDDITRLYVNDKPITFNKLEKTLSAIKQVINENDFWTKTNSDPAIDQARTTIYNHIMKLRDAEVDAASNLKDDELATLEVHKTDMNNISHSLFLGNHAGCCTAVGSSIGNDYAAPRYIMDKCISAIEVMDGKEFVGNTMCYFAEVDGKLALVLDNIEMSAKYQNNDKIRDVFMDYAKQLCEEVGKPDLPIYAGPYRHKFNMSPYTMDSHDLKIIGSTDGEDTYIDFAGRYVIDGEKVSRTNLYKIR